MTHYFLGADVGSTKTHVVIADETGRVLGLGEGGAGNTATLPKTLPPADLSIEKVLALLKAKAEGPRDLGRRASLDEERARRGVDLGRHALERAVEHPRDTIASVKRLMGRGADDPETWASI